MAGNSILVWDSIQNHACRRLALGLTDLLENRHLYQSFDMADARQEWAASAHQKERSRNKPSMLLGGGHLAPTKSADQFEGDYTRYVDNLWTFHLETEGAVLQADLQDHPGCPVPALNLRCSHCKAGRTFIPLAVHPCGHGWYKGKPQQSWSFEYHCPTCKNCLHFFLTREGNRLRLCGRFPAKEVEVPDEFPELLSKYISEAKIATQAGKHLAGVLYLRVGIEQFWRSLPEVMLQCPHEKPTGEQLGDAYNKTLPAEMKAAAVPTLKSIYERLSNAIHGADESAGPCDDGYKDVLKHFKARHLYANEIEDRRAKLSAPPESGES